MTVPAALRRRTRITLVMLCALLARGSIAAAAAEPLTAYNVDLRETTVSGVSSGAYMAVQFGVAHSAIVKGVGATAGGPYLCAFDRVPPLRGAIVTALARCMQGDPDFPRQAITSTQLNRMVRMTDAWARSGRIDPTSHLARQRIWLFHGYNDGLVKAPVTDALYDYYGRYIDQSRVFYKNNLNAAHAQITVDCGVGDAVCNPCPKTGGNFLNLCGDPAADEAPYDAAGSMLQLFYGALTPRVPASAAGCTIVRFAQGEFALDGRAAPAPRRISMADDGFVYVPDSCARGEPCRVHIAFHGCGQSAEQIGSAFYEHAGYNRWADDNHLIVLYPQTRPSQPTAFAPLLPLNPQACWDWWGYNDGLNNRGRFATRAGLQIAAVRRMLDRLAEQHSAVAAPAVRGEPGAPTSLVVGDFTHRQVALRWGTVSGAVGYNVYRSLAEGGPFGEGQRLNPHLVESPFFVDSGLRPRTRYFYVVRAVSRSNRETADSVEVSVLTAMRPPPCDPFFSFRQGTPVTKNNTPTEAVCP
jgi:poly(3-hydroxybutyrate) depolymerase